MTPAVLPGDRYQNRFCARPQPRANRSAISLPTRRVSNRFEIAEEFVRLRQISTTLPTQTGALRLALCAYRSAKGLPV